MEEQPQQQIAVQEKKETKINKIVICVDHEGVEGFYDKTVNMFS